MTCGGHLHAWWWETYALSLRKLDCDCAVAVVGCSAVELLNGFNSISHVSSVGNSVKINFTAETLQRANLTSSNAAPKSPRQAAKSTAPEPFWSTAPNSSTTSIEPAKLKTSAAHWPLCNLALDFFWWMGRMLSNFWAKRKWRPGSVKYCFWKGIARIW